MSKPVKIILAVIGSLIVLAGIGYYALGSYANSENSSAASPLTQKSDPAGSSQPAGSIAGQWKSTEGSTAGYRVHEALNGKDVTVVGRTDDVTGTVTASARAVRSASVSVALKSVQTNSKARDSYFRSNVVDVDKHPRASFTLTDPVSLDELAMRTGQLTVKAHGRLRMNGAQHAVLADLTVTRKSDSVVVTGSVPVTWSDYDITPPNLGFVQVRDSGRVEFRTVFTKS